ncbi:MAG: radical SAM protein [bacterium]
MFSDHLDQLTAKVEAIGTLATIGAKETTALLDRCARGVVLSDEEIILLMNGTRNSSNRKAILDFARGYRRPHDREILLLPPLYFDSICENSCSYCNFSQNGVRLTLKDFEAEFRFLLDLGFRSIELVSSQDPELYEHDEDFDVHNQVFRIESLLPYFQLTQKLLKEAGGGMLTTNIPPLDTRVMKTLRKTGLDCFLVWQETFNAQQYARLHIEKGPKISQAFRLNSMERALKAGIPHVAGAFLKNLYDWRKEEAMLYFFDRHLKTECGHGLSIVGSPRVKGSFLQSPLIQPYFVSDEDYELNIAIDRVLFDGILWMQTRESFEFNRTLITRYGGGVILTLISSTAPGGYSKPTETHSQFPVFKQDLYQSVDELEKIGFKSVFDWNSDTLNTFQRRS